MDTLPLLYFALLTFCGVLSEVTSLNDTSKNVIKKSNIYKCKCGMKEALSNGTCVPSTNPVQVWDYIKQQDLTLDISSFSSVRINPINCSIGYTKLNLNRTHFVIYTNGLLDNLILLDESPTYNYCIEHIITENGDIDLTAEVCEQNPTISVCCLLGYVINSDGKCEHRNDVPFEPPLIGDFKWNGYNTTEQNITCGERQVLKQATVTQPHYFGASLVSYPIGSKLQWHAIDNLPQYYSSNEYCLAISEKDQQWIYEAYFCESDKRLEIIEKCSSTVCIRKCCPYNFVYDQTYASCVQYFDHQIKYVFIDSYGDTIPDPSNFTIMLGLPFCEEVQSIFYSDNDTDKITFYENGSLSKGPMSYSALEYCVDGYSFNIQDPNVTVINSAFVCHRGLEDPCSWRWIIGSVLLCISCLFYMLTIVVYAAIEELRRKMIGKCLISQVSALLISYLTLIFLINNNDYSVATCILPGTIEHVAILASFFWLNVMCYDMWSNIRIIKVSRSSKPTSKKFIFYCIYAWGIPLLIASTRLIIDTVPHTGQNWLIQSHLGETHCFFSGIYDPLPKWLYLYVPILILLSINVFFFTHVAIVIVRTKREAERLLKGPDSSKTGKNLNAKKEKALLYLKLFLVMGITWILEIVMWIAVEENDCRFWGVDIINMFQGVFIFIIFVCKKSTLQKVKGQLLSGTTTKEEYCLTEPERSRDEVNNVVA